MVRRIRFASEQLIPWDVVLHQTWWPRHPKQQFRGHQPSPVFLPFQTVRLSLSNSYLEATEGFSSIGMNTRSMVVQHGQPPTGASYHPVNGGFISRASQTGHRTTFDFEPSIHGVPVHHQRFLLALLSLFLKPQLLRELLRPATN